MADSLFFTQLTILKFILLYVFLFIILFCIHSIQNKHYIFLYLMYTIFIL